MIKYYENVENNGAMAKGKKELLAHLDGKQLTARQACIAKCYDCMGWFADGKNDCKCYNCSIYSFMPYGSKPKVKRVVSDENRQAASERLKKAREGIKQ
jgi:hypothetical protein